VSFQHKTKIGRTNTGKALRHRIDTASWAGRASQVSGSARTPEGSVLGLLDDQQEDLHSTEQPTVEFLDVLETKHLRHSRNTHPRRQLCCTQREGALFRNNLASTQQDKAILWSSLSRACGRESVHTNLLAWNPLRGQDPELWQ